MTLANRTLILIPAYKPGQPLLDLLKELSELGIRDYLIVDDGSGKSFEKVFADAKTIFGAEILRHAINAGQGAAVKTGLAFAKANSLPFDFIITADADGQHLAKDIYRLTESSVPEKTVLLGARSFGSGTPLRSILGNRISSVLFLALFGRWLKDTQTGLRKIPVALVNEILLVKSNRFDFAMDFLIHCSRNGIGLKNFDIDTKYMDEDNSNSHFQPVRDSAIIMVKLFGQFFKYSSSSLVSSAVDIILFSVILDRFFGRGQDPIGVFWSISIARIVSSSMNYLVNRKVFRSKSSISSTSLKYIALAISLVLASSVVTNLLNLAFSGHVVWAKICADTLLFFASFTVQRIWVFKHQVNR